MGRPPEKRVAQRLIAAAVKIAGRLGKKLERETKALAYLLAP
jgi:hypothetical protein